MIYLFFGPDNLRSGRKTEAIRKKFLENNHTGSGFSSIDAGDGKESGIWRPIERGLASPGLFFPKQLVIVQNLILEGGAEEKAAVLEGMKKEKTLSGDRDRVLLYWENGQPKEKDKLFAYLSKIAQCQRFDILRGTALERWIDEEAGRIIPEIRFSPAAARELMLAVGDDQLRMAQEIEKMALFQGKGEIGEKVVRELVKSESDPEIFSVIEALSGGKKPLALRLFHEKLESGAEPLYILSMYVYQFRNLLRIGEYYWSGERSASQIARKVGIHPFVVEKGMRDLGRKEEAWFRRVYLGLIRIDQEAKNGEVDAKLSLDRFIASV